MSASHVLVPHDDGTWRLAQLLDQYRDRRTGRWMAVVRYYAGIGEQYQRALWADDCRAMDDPPPGWIDLCELLQQEPATLPGVRPLRVWP
jgi:hypothetical protein